LCHLQAMLHSTFRHRHHSRLHHRPEHLAFTCRHQRHLSALKVLLNMFLLRLHTLYAQKHTLTSHFDSCASTIFMAMVLTKQTYNNQGKHKKPKDIHKKPRKLNLANQTNPGFRLLQHPARKRIGPILTKKTTARGARTGQRDRQLNNLIRVSYIMTRR